MKHLVFLCAAAAWAQAPQAPGALTVQSATSKQVQLSWNASEGAKSYSVERKSDDGYAAVLAATTPSAIDISIDPYTTYTYRVIAINDAGPSGPSNEVTVGPPPYGFNVVTPGPVEDTQTRVGDALRMVPDANGDPALAYTVLDPDADGDYTDSTLWFVCWNRARYQWNAPAQIAKIGSYSSGAAVIPISLARDASTGLLGVAYQRKTADAAFLHLATSADGGATWSVRTVSTEAGLNYSEPSVALGGGQIYLAYSVHEQGIRYLTGKAEDDPQSWKVQIVPMPGGYGASLELLSLALDSAGNPGLAFLAANDANSAEAFWRPGSAGGSVVIADNNGFNDVSDISLSFYGAEPRIAFAGARGDNYYSDYDFSVWVMRSSNDGGNWLPPVSVPSDGRRSMVGPISLASGPGGQAALVVSDDGGIIDTAKYGFPKLSRSDDLLAFQTTGLALAGEPDFSADCPVVLFGGNGKLWVAFSNRDYWDKELGTGILVWREK